MPKMVYKHRNRQLSVCHRKLYWHYLFFYICVCVDMKLVKCIFVITS